MARLHLGMLGSASLTFRRVTSRLPSEDERTRIVVNGEFYGYEVIQRELEAHGHLRGEFAIVLWDETRRRLIAVRERFGIKPLFYAWHDNTLYLASGVKGLFAAGVPACWDEESVFHA